MWGSYYFGVEIELIAEPHLVRHPLLRNVYYEKLAVTLRHYGAAAIADRLDSRYSKHPEHYDKWWITKDGSLGDPEHPLIPLEAVSPILSTDFRWEDNIDTFWRAWARIFHMPGPSRRCGSHIHVSPSPTKRFTISQLRSIAFGVVYYEQYVHQLLPEYRQNNKYCQPNTGRSDELQRLLDRVNGDPRAVWAHIRTIYSPSSLRDFMQGSTQPKNDRYVLWNFDNILPGRSGTVEFRGGRALRGQVRTKRWIAFVVSFVHMCISQDFDSGDSFDGITAFWQGLRRTAEDISVKQHLPSSWRVMAELASDNTYEEMADDLDDTNSDDDSAILDKSDSEYADSEYSDHALEQLMLELERDRNRCVIL